MQKSKEWIIPIWAYTKALITFISHWALAFLVFIGGILLLLSAATPSLLERVVIADKLLTTPVLNLSHQLSVVSAITLLFLSRGIYYRVKRAYHLTFVMLIIGAIFTFIKGFDYEEAIVILSILFILWLSRRRFYRENLALSWEGLFTEGLMIVLVLFVYIFIGYLSEPYSVKLSRRIDDLIVPESGALFLSGMIGLVLATFVLWIGYRGRTSSKFPIQQIGEDTTDIETHLEKYEGNVLSHLIFLKDKYIYWAQDGKVLFQYQRIADKIVVLGSPIGEKESIIPALEEFMDLATRFGYRLVFYQIDKKEFQYYHEMGFQFFKLGEEAYVDLKTFSLSGNKKKNLRAVKNKLEREGYVIEVVDPAFSEELYQELKVVSDVWLGDRKEKGFSLGYFDREYVMRSAIVVMRDPEDQIIAFATLMPVYDQDQTISIDLMRFLPETPNGTMDMLFSSMLNWAKEQGYSQFNLGMAPLSNVGINKYAFLSEKVAYEIFVHGNFLYNFAGLKRFKSKYADSWEPKYLAYRRKFRLPFTMAQMSLLIRKVVKVKD